MRFYIFTTLILYSCLLYSANNTPIDRTLVYSTSQWPPSYFIEDGVHKGVEYEITQEISKRLGLKITYQVLPWARSLQNFKTGKASIGSGLSKNNYLKKYLNYSKHAVTEMKILVLSRDDSPIMVKNLSSLDGRKVLVGRGYLYGPKLDHIKNMKSIEVNDEIQQLKMLSSGRAPFAIMHEWQYHYYRKKFAQNIRIAYTLDHVPRYYVFTKKMSPESYRSLSKNIDNIIVKLKEEGFIQKIIKKYISHN
jgi:ABC-type amino acid transport substrate-binding protein